ncbi:Acetyltransferase (GNAT) domain-containing protein [Lentibacillus halodurans]|uniref:Acetyltransferase (GNAT) domain-containing protein n=1 Tax=Lentibacillus halodurans TaxID=237679 RepID=A0A1I0X6E0_9BACI|nr:GNAT family N-acetyltransferase [Lentibacillus halodurans]SFA96217.1 Acetyltransferase (GNAT) domain-containing protein [Lentibacillus halodurans]
MTLTRNDNITLQCYHPRFHSQLENYYLKGDHHYYTAHPIDAIKDRGHDRHPIVLVKNQTVIGFFVLHGWNGVRKYTGNRQAMLLRAYSIDSRQQGKGYAKQSLQLLTPFFKNHFPEKKEIILAVNLKNTAAQHVYKKAGFVDKGKRVMGKKGEQLILHRGL